MPGVKNKIAKRGVLSNNNEKTASYLNALPQRERGFVFIELLIVILVGSMIVFLSIPFYQTFYLNAQIDNTTEEIIGMLRSAQASSMQGEEDAEFGIHIENGKYVLFKDPPYDPADPFNLEFLTPANITLGIYSLSGSDIIFSKLTGDPLNWAYIYIYKSGALKRRILVYRTGYIYVNKY